MAQRESIPGMNAGEIADSTNDLTSIRDELRRFAKAREWDQFHSPKNLAVALSVEAGELLEHFQWMTEVGSANLPQDRRDEVALEIADVLIYLVRLADKLDIKLADAVVRKIAINEAKHPIEKARGKYIKYDDL